MLFKYHAPIYSRFRGLTPRDYEMEMRNTAKKRNFSKVEIESIMLQVQLNKLVLAACKVPSKEVRKVQCGKKSMLRSIVLASTIELLRFESLIYASIISM